MFQQQRWNDSRIALRRCLELLPAHPHRLSYLSLLRECDRLLATGDAPAPATAPAEPS